MKAVIQLETGFCVFYLSENAHIDFLPTLEVSNNSTNVGDFKAPFLNAGNCEIISGMPEINFEYRTNQYRIVDGAWVVIPIAASKPT